MQRILIKDATSAKKFELPFHNKSVVIFDIDNTLLQPLEGDLGSDQWFDALFQQISAFKCYPDIYQELIQIVLKLYFEVQQHIEVKPVEQAIVDYFNLLRESHVRILLVTARGADLAERTVQQLKDIGLSMPINHDEYSKLANGKTDQPPAYQGGIIYCSGNNKGHCVRTWLRLKKLKVFFFYVIDDKLKNIQDILNSLNRNYKTFKGLRYGHLDEHVKNFNLEATKQQIDSLSSKVTTIAELNKQYSVTLYQALNYSDVWRTTLFYKVNHDEENAPLEKDDKRLGFLPP